MSDRSAKMKGMKDKVLEIIKRDGTEDTKHIASALGISMNKTYKICLELESEGRICKYGYWIEKESAWEDPVFSTHHWKSLTWQFVK